MFPQLMLGSKAVGTALVRPNIVSVAELKLNTTADWTTQTFSFSSTTGNIVVLFSTRCTSTSPDGFIGSWAGAALTEARYVEQNVVGAGLANASWIRGGATGVHDLVITADADDQRDVLGWAISFDRLAAVPLGALAGTSVTSLQTSYDVTLNVQDGSSRLLALVAAMNSNVFPLTASAGWTLHQADRTGTGTASDISAVLAHQAAGATGNTTMTASGPASTDDWVSLAVEVLPS
jgi:hypothetical protein